MENIILLKKRIFNIFYGSKLYFIFLLIGWIYMYIDWSYFFFDIGSVIFDVYLVVVWGGVRKGDVFVVRFVYC